MHFKYALYIFTKQEHSIQPIIDLSMKI
jgi:hypothetical protein